MQGKKTLSLGTARWIVLAMYIGGLVVYPIVGALAGDRPSAEPELTRVLPFVFLGVSVMGYVFSLVLERTLVAQARKTKSEMTAAQAAIVSGAFGESFAIFGLVLTFAGVGNWALPFYVLCFVHGVHLLVRWPSLESAVSSESYETE